MKYMLMIYDNPDTRSVFFGPDGDALMAEMNALMAELTESGELVSTDALADPASSKVVRVRDGVPVITDGPLAEAKELYAEAEASARKVQEEAQDRAAELVAQARQQAEEIARETEQVLREHGEVWDDVRTHIGQMRNSLTALTGQAAQE